MSSGFAHDRIDRISKIMPEFCNVAQVGDEVMMGLEGDPSFPFTDSNRLTATISKVDHSDSGPEITLDMSNGRQKTVNQYTIAPGEVFEYTDKSFSDVLDRERTKHMAVTESRSESPVYRGSDLSELKQEISQLRSELQAERDLTRSFHQTYLAGLKELTNDVCQLDSSGTACQFCRTFNAEYDKMRARAEEGTYRGTSDVEEEGEEEEDEEDSLSSEEDLMAESDFF